MTTIVLSCFVFRVDSFRFSDFWTNVRKYLDDLFKTPLCMISSMAIFRLHLKGARLKWRSAFASDIQSSDTKKMVQCYGAKTMLHAWYIAAVRHSRYEIN